MNGQVQQITIISYKKKLKTNMDLEDLQYTETFWLSLDPISAKKNLSYDQCETKRATKKDRESMGMLTSDSQVYIVVQKTSALWSPDLPK